ncbi:hypothetical protein BH11PSE10_BH11PSE10_05870 [soil metagenome]
MTCTSHKFLLATAMVCASTGALAASGTFVTNSLGFGSGVPATSSFASMTITTDGNDLDVSISANGLSSFGSSASLASIVFAVPDTSTLGPTIANVSGGSSVALGGGGGVAFPNSTIPSGTALAHFDLSQTSDLLTQGQTVGFKWLGPFNVTSISFMANVQGIDLPDADASAWYTMSLLANVPEPTPYALLLAGLGVIGYVVRRRLV